MNRAKKFSQVLMIFSGTALFSSGLTGNVQAIFWAGIGMTISLFFYCVMLVLQKEA